jgi:hypothetical protein
VDRIGSDQIDTTSTYFWAQRLVTPSQSSAEHPPDGLFSFFSPDSNFP